MPDLKTKVKVGPAGQETEYEVTIPGVTPDADVSAKFMPKDSFEAEMGRRVSKLTQGTVKLEEIDKVDDATKAAIAEKLGFKPAGAPGVPNEQVAAEVTRARDEATRAVMEREVKPREQKLTKAQQRIAKLTNYGLKSEILTAAQAAGVKPYLLTGAAGLEAPIVAMVQSAFGYDEETETWYAKEGDGYRMSPTPTKDRLNMTVAEFIADWAAQKANGEFVNSQAQGGPGVGGSGNKSGGGNSPDVWLTDEEARDTPTYNAALDRATKQGGRVRVKQREGIF